MNWNHGGPLFDRVTGDEKLRRKEEHKHVSILQRIDHFTWANFTLPMATGGLALLMSVQPHTFHGLETIGKVLYILDLVIWMCCTSLIATRFIRRPAALKASLSHSTESLFFPTFFLTIPTIVGCMVKYGSPHTGTWLITTARVLFWIYVAATFTLAVCQYLVLFTGRQLTVQGMTPGWLLPIFPVMLSGTVASVIAPYVPESDRMPILVAGMTFQGLGFWTAMLMYPIFMHRLMQYGLPNPALRPGLFISVGPPSFTGLALIGMARSLPTSYGYFVNHPTAIETIQQLALVFAIFVWSLSFWFFCVSAISCAATVPHMDFHLVFYAFVFPNTGFAIVIIDIGEQLHSQAIMWVGSILSILLVAMWIFVVAMHARAVWRQDIMMPGLDEDKDE